MWRVVAVLIYEFQGIELESEEKIRVKRMFRQSTPSLGTPGLLGPVVGQLSLIIKVSWV